MLENVKFEVKLDLNEGATQLANTPLGFAMTTGCKVLVAPVLEQCVYGVQRYENAKNFLEAMIEPRIQNIPEEYWKLPQKRVLLNTLNSVIDLEAHETTLQEMFANLLAGSMDNRKSEGVHPSYAKIISELSEDDAKFLKMLDQKKMVLFLIVYDINKNKSYYVYDSIPNYSNKGNLGIIFDTVIHQGLVSQNSIYPKKNYSIDILNDAVKWFNETEPSILNDLNIVDCKNVCINRYSMELTTRGKDFMQAVTLKESSTDEKS